jgi:ribosomal protein S18 acetylase RimI-like enzyme
MIEFQCATLPVTYPSSFFYDLLRSDSQEKISLVATLPSTSVQGYFEVLSSLGHHPGSHLVSSSTTHHGHLTHHHVTSPLSGRKPISLDVVGTITARIAPGPTAPSVRILTLCVSPSYRRFGVGRLLLDSLLKQIKNRFARLLPLNKPLSNPSIQSRIIVNLHVQATNKVAYAFYLRAGFSPVCFKPAYYSDNDLKPLDPALKKISSSSSLRQSSSLELSSSLLSSFNPSSLSHQQTLLSQPDPPSTVNSDSDESVDVDAWFLELSLDCS